MGYLFAVRSGRGVFLYDYEMRYITGRGLRREEERKGREEEEKGRNGQNKARQGYCTILVSCIFSFIPSFYFSYSLFS